MRGEREEEFKRRGEKSVATVRRWEENLLEKGRRERKRKGKKRKESIK